MAQGFNDFDAGKSIMLAIEPKWQLASTIGIRCSTDRAATMIKFGKIQILYLEKSLQTEAAFGRFLFRY
jgi:hypothetical protein